MSGKLTPPYWRHDGHVARTGMTRTPGAFSLQTESEIIGDGTIEVILP